jgi:hypothetical protein
MTDKGYSSLDLFSKMTQETIAATQKSSGHVSTAPLLEGPAGFEFLPPVADPWDVSRSSGMNTTFNDSNGDQKC